AQPQSTLICIKNRQLKLVTARRFPPPWSVEDLGACLVVKDSTGQKLAADCYEEEPGRRFGGQAADQRRGAAALLCGPSERLPLALHLVLPDQIRWGHVSLCCSASSLSTACPTRLAHSIGPRRTQGTTVQGLQTTAQACRGR